MSEMTLSTQVKLKNWSCYASVDYLGKNFLNLVHPGSNCTKSFTLAHAKSLQDASSVHYRRMGFPRHYREARATDFYSSPRNRNTGGLRVEKTEFVACRQLRNSRDWLRLGRDITGSHSCL